MNYTIVDYRLLLLQALRYNAVYITVFALFMTICITYKINNKLYLTINMS